jgi:chromosome segregation ATPase
MSPKAPAGKSELKKPATGSTTAASSKAQEPKAPEPKVEKKVEVEMSPVRKVLGGKKEEAMQALTDGFQNLSRLLEGIQGNLTSQGDRADDLNKKVADLPVLAKAQVDFLTKVSGQLETQTARTGELLSKLSGLPNLLDGIHKTLEKQVAAEERSEKTLHDFRKTMNNIHDSIGNLTRENSKALKASTESLERTNKRTTQTFEKTQTQAYASFEKAQKANLTQLSAIMERSTKMNRTMIVLLAVLFAGLAVLFVLVLNGQAG